MFFVSKKKYNATIKELNDVWEIYRRDNMRLTIATATLRRIADVKTLFVVKKLVKSALKEINEVK